MPSVEIEICPDRPELWPDERKVAAANRLLAYLQSSRFSLPGRKLYLTEAKVIGPPHRPMIYLILEEDERNT